MAIDFRSYLLFKSRAVRSFGQFVTWFSNWREIWQAYRTGQTLPPLKLRSGLVIHHGKGDDPVHLFREIFVDRCYTGRFYQPAPTDVVLDVGANIGMFTIHLNTLAPGIRVHCYEPGPRTFESLSQNISANRLTNVTAHREAVTSLREIRQLSNADMSGNRSLITPSLDGQGTDSVSTVPMMEVVENCNQGAIDFLKVDIEGAEYEVFDATPLTAWRGVQRIAMEYHERISPGTRDMVTKKLRDAGFQIRCVPLSADDTLGILYARR